MNNDVFPYVSLLWFDHKAKMLKSGSEVELMNSSQLYQEVLCGKKLHSTSYKSKISLKLFKKYYPFPFFKQIVIFNLTKGGRNVTMNR